MNKILMNQWKRDMKYQLDSTETTVKQHSYRSASLKHILFEVERDSDLENFLASKANKRTDNHTLYEITFADGNVFGISCSDSKMRIGVGIFVGCW